MARVIITTPGVYDMPTADYFADPVPGGSLSSTGARKLVKRGGPAKFKYALDNPKDSGFSDAFDFGKAAHQVVLGDADDRLVVIDAGNWRTKSAQDQRDAAREAGLTPVLVTQMMVVTAMADAILANPTAAALLRAASGKPERSLFWQDPETSVWCRARVDWFRHPVEGQRFLLVDYKTCASADEDDFSKSTANYGYFQQDDFYCRGVKTLGIDADPAFLFVAQEKEPPYLVNVIQLDETAKVIGMNQNRAAIHTYQECKRTGEWPGYGAEVKTVSLPAWFVRQFDEEPDAA